MKRDMGLIREILLRIEEPGEPSGSEEFRMEGFCKQETDYNLNLLISAGFVEGRVARAFGNNSSIFVDRLTWSGHDFLDAIRDDSVWTKTKEKARLAGQDAHRLPLEVIKGLAVSATKELFGLG